MSRRVDANVAQAWMMFVNGLILDLHNGTSGERWDTTGVHRRLSELADAAFPEDEQPDIDSEIGRVFDQLPQPAPGVASDEALREGTLNTDTRDYRLGYDAGYEAGLIMGRADAAVRVSEATVRREWNGGPLAILAMLREAGVEVVE